MCLHTNTSLPFNWVQIRTIDCNRMKVEYPQGTPHTKRVKVNRFRGHGWAKRGTKKSRREARQKAQQQRFYVVAVGWRPGIFDDWSSANSQVKGYLGAVHQSFETLKEAYSFMRTYWVYPPSVHTPFPPCPDTPLPPDKYVYPPAPSDEETDSGDEHAPLPTKTRRRVRWTGWTPPPTKTRYMADPPATFYAVVRGLNPGIYCDWATASIQVIRVNGARFKKFDNLPEARVFMRLHGA